MDVIRHRLFRKKSPRCQVKILFIVWEEISKVKRQSITKQPVLKQNKHDFPTEKIIRCFRPLTETNYQSPGSGHHLLMQQKGIGLHVHFKPLFDIRQSCICR